MILKVSAISIILLLTTIILGLLALYIWRRRKTKGGIYFSTLLLSSTLWAFAVAMESMSLTLEGRILWSKISYLGIINVGPLWLLFTLKYSQVNPKSIRRVQYFMWIIPVISLLLVFTNELHHLIWTDFSLISETIESGVIYHHGIAFFIHLIYSYSLLFFGTILFIRQLLSSSKQDKIKILFLLLALFIPWIGNVIYIAVGSPIFGGIELTPVALLTTGIIITFIVFQYKFLHIVPIAREHVYNSLESGIIIIDEHGAVADFNAAARKILSDHIRIGTDAAKIKIENLSFSAILNNQNVERKYFHPKTNKWFNIDVSELRGLTKASSGKIIFFYDITPIQEVQLQLSQSKHLLESIIDFLPDATFVINNKQEIIIWNRAMEELSGLPTSQILGRSDYEYAIPFYNKKRPILIDFALKQKWDKSLTNMYSNFKQVDDVIMGEVFVKHVKNEGAHLWGIAKPLYNSDGNIIGAIETIRDITLRKNAAQELEEKVEELEKLNRILVNRELKMVELKDKLRMIE